MKRSKYKNCLNCAFCTRNRDNFITYPPVSNKEPFWTYSQESLTNEERKLLKQGNDSFIGEGKIKFDKWVKIYYEKQKAHCNALGISTEGINVFNAVSNDKYSDYERYGIENPPPEKNDKDYLSCWKEHWDEENNPELISKRKELGIRCCKHFYDFKNIGDKSLELCNEERIEENDSKRFYITLTIGIVTMFLALLTLIATIKVN